MHDRSPVGYSACVLAATLSATNEMYPTDRPAALSRDASLRQKLLIKLAVSLTDTWPTSPSTDSMNAKHLAGHSLECQFYVTGMRTWSWFKPQLHTLKDALTTMPLTPWTLRTVKKLHKVSSPHPDPVLLGYCVVNVSLPLLLLCSPAISLGFTILGEIFAYVTVF